MGETLKARQRRELLRTLNEICADSWKVLVADDDSKRLIFSIASEDQILGANITSIETLATLRQSQPDIDAIYVLTPQPHVLQTLERDLNDRRYRRAFLVWTSKLPNRMREMLYRSESRSAHIGHDQTLNMDFYPQEPQLVTFREPWSFPILFNDSCRQMLSSHLEGIVKKIFSLCMLLKEFPIIRYYRPQSNHDAARICERIAIGVRELLDLHAQEFLAPSTNPRSVLIITDRTMDLMAPLIHSLTYQAMVMDVLPIRDVDAKLFYRFIINQGYADQEEKDIELSEADSLWSEYRHYSIEKVSEVIIPRFHQFMDDNKDLVEAQDKVEAEDLQNMLVKLRPYLDKKELFTQNIDMVNTCANIFTARLHDLVTVEQVLATQRDESEKKPKNVGVQIVQLLDVPRPGDPDFDVAGEPLKPEERLRLLIMYVLYRGGTLKQDVELLLSHAGLRSELEKSIRGDHGRESKTKLEIFDDLEVLGWKIYKTLRDNLSMPPLLLPDSEAQVNERKKELEALEKQGKYPSMDRFKPALANLLEKQHSGTLDDRIFPYLDRVDQMDAERPAAAGNEPSLRFGGKPETKPEIRPNWQNANRPKPIKRTQRIIVFMAGGATYSEARECHVVPEGWRKEVYLVTSHMLTPSSFVQHLRELGRPMHELPLPRNPEVPAWVTARPSQGLPNGPNGQGPRPPVNAMQKMNLGTRPSESRPPPRGASPAQTRVPSSQPSLAQHDEGKQKKEKKDKKHGFSSMFKKH